MHMHEHESRAFSRSPGPCESARLPEDFFIGFVSAISEDLLIIFVSSCSTMEGCTAVEREVDKVLVKFQGMHKVSHK